MAGQGTGQGYIGYVFWVTYFSRAACLYFGLHDFGASIIL